MLPIVQILNLLLTKTAVNFICDHPDIKAISFVGSNQAGEYIYDRGTKTGKRVQSNMGAKNHGVVLPDANKVFLNLSFNISFVNFFTYFKFFSKIFKQFLLEIIVAFFYTICCLS